MRKPVRPCIDRLSDGKGCPEYALPGESRCEEHHALAAKNRTRPAGTTAAWRRARLIALKRTGYTCEKCGRTDAQAKADGTWLEVHHRRGEGVRAAQHNQADLQVLCRQPCHLDTLRAKTRPTLAEHQAELRKGFSQ
ncbi:MAG: hypothetical protein WKF96_03350 [Solirubrobacteraceae bacterium]